MIPITGIILLVERQLALDLYKKKKKRMMKLEFSFGDKMSSCLSPHGICLIRFKDA